MSGDFDSAKKNVQHASMIDAAWTIRIHNFFGEVSVDISNYFGQLGVDMSNAFGKVVNDISNYIKSSESLGKIYDSVSSTITAVQNFVGKLFFDVGNIIDSALLSTRKKVAELADKFIPDFAKNDSIKKFISETKAEAEAPKKAYVPYVAQKFSENYKQTEFKAKTFQKDTYTPIANPAQDALDAEKNAKNAAYDENKRFANKAASAKDAANVVSAKQVAGGSSAVPVDYSGKLSNLTPQQTAIAEKIYSSFIAAGFRDVQAQAAVVNAYAESRFNPNATNITSKEASYGLFQLNTKGGVGDGYSPEYLKDVDNNIALIIREAQSEKGNQFRASNTLETATSTFAQYVERPYDSEQVGKNRAAMATNSASMLSGFLNRRVSASNENFRNFERSNVNSPTDAPKGTASDPVIVAPGAVDPVQKSLQKNVNDATLKTPELSKEQLDEMKKQQAYREKIDAENKKYRDERDNLEKQFRATLENSIKDKLTSAIPMGVTGSAATTNAGGNIANKFLSSPLENLATKIFGKQAGKPIGQIFTQLAGSYGNQLIGSVLAPAFGMSSEQMNRSLNNFASGNKGAGWSDLLYGMTGIPTDLRTAFGYEDGISNFYMSLADITATPFSPLFKMDTSTSGVSAAEVSSTNAGIIEQNAAIQNAKIQIAGSTSAAQEFIKGVSQAAQNFENSVTGENTQSKGGILGSIKKLFMGEKQPNGGWGGFGDEIVTATENLNENVTGFGEFFDKPTVNGGWGGFGDEIVTATEKMGTFGDTLGNVFGQKLPGFDVSSDLIGGGTKVSSLTPFGTFTMDSSSTKDIGLLGRFGNMLSGGKAKNPINAGADFITSLAGSFIGNKLGIPKNSYGGAVAQTAINATIKNLLTSGGTGLGQTLANLAPGAMLGKGIVNIGSMIGGTAGNTLSAFGGGLAGSPATMSSGQFALEALADPVSIFGEGATAAGTFAGQAGAVLGALGSGLAAVSITKALSGGYTTGVNDVVNAAVAIGAMFGPVGMIGSALIGAAVNRLFGRKAPELKGMGIEGTIGASKEAGGSGTSLQGWKNMYEKGGTYRSDRNTPSTFAIDPEVAAALMKDVDSSLTNIKTATSMLGLTSDKKLEDFTKAIKLDFQNKSVEQQQKMLVETLTTFNNEMLDSVFPTFKNFAMAGEKPIDVMNRLASSLGNVNAASMMLGYGDNFATAAGAIAGDYANSVLSSGFNMEVLRAQGIASGKVSNADYYGGIAELLTPAVAAKGYMGQALEGSGDNSYIVDTGWVETSAAKEAVYRTVSSDANSLLQSSRNADALLQADAANTIVQAFGGNTAFQTATTRYFDAFYTDKEKNAVRLKLAKRELDRIAKDVGGSTGTPLTDVNAGTKAQDKIDEYRAKTDAAYSTYLANPTADNLNKWKTLVLNSESYKASVTTSIAAQKYEANPIDAAAKNAEIRAALATLSYKGVTGPKLTAAQLAGGTTLGASALTGYSVSPNIAQIMGGKGTNAVVAVPIYGGIVPGNNSASASSVVTSQGAGTLFAPTTYVDNSSVTSTNVNGSTGGGDNVRDTYSHPILGSTERSISSTYNYNFLYR